VLGSGQPSGYGFEITFRLKKDKKDTTPPTWPAELMQSLAKYVFQSGMDSIPDSYLPLLDHRQFIVSW